MTLTSTPPSLASKLRPYLPSLLVVAACAAGFVYLRRGSLDVSSGAVGYGEDVHRSVSSVAPGRIVELKVEVGQAVKAGDVLAVLDRRALEVAREGAVAELDLAKAELIAAGQDEDSKVTRAELWVLRARAAERGDRASLAEISGRMARLDGLLEKQMVPAGEAESTRERMRALSARVGAYDQAASHGQAGLDKSLSSDHSKLVDARIEPSRIAVRVREVALKKLELELEERVIKAPVDGVVSTVSHRVGEVVDTATEIASLVTSRPGVVVAILPERAAERVVVGSPAELHRPAAFSHALMGDVIEVAPEIEEVPIRARVAPTLPAWGRRVTIRLRGQAQVFPGEAFRVVLP